MRLRRSRRARLTLASKSRDLSKRLPPQSPTNKRDEKFSDAPRWRPMRIAALREVLARSCRPFEIAAGLTLAHRARPEYVIPQVIDRSALRQNRTDARQAAEALQEGVAVRPEPQ